MVGALGYLQDLLDDGDVAGSEKGAVTKATNFVDQAIEAAEAGDLYSALRLLTDGSEALGCMSADLLLDLVFPCNGITRAMDILVEELEAGTAAAAAASAQGSNLF